MMELVESALPGRFLGGVVQGFVLGLPKGWAIHFGGVESRLASLSLPFQRSKVSFGDGFAACGRRDQKTMISFA